MKNESLEYDEPQLPENRLKEIKNQLKIHLNLELSSEELEEIIRPWQSYIKGYNKVAKFDVEKKRALLDKFIEKLEAMIQTIEKLGVFKTQLEELMQLFYLEKKISTDYNDLLQLISKKIEVLKQERYLLEMKKNCVVNQKILEGMAIKNLFVLGEKKYGLKSGSRGRNNNSQLVEFVMIISGLSGESTVKNHYNKHRELQNNTETLPSWLLI
jgi:cell fate (sporulation/competence/biofilm development) regulator YmcA (YheA/YmcA/DUF963 family)